MQQQTSKLSPLEFPLTSSHTSSFFTEAQSSFDGDLQKSIASMIQTLDLIAEQTRVKQSTKVLEGSKISVRDARKYFHCGEQPYECIRRSIPTPSQKLQNKISLLVQNYSQKMLQQLTEGLIGEVAYVQSYVRETLLPGLVQCLRHRKSVVEEYERSYRVTFECQSDEVSEKVTVNGKTGHTLKLKNSDFRLLTIEDKSICLPLNESAIAQARSEMMSELEELYGCIQLKPPEFYGILQNGCDWIFIKCLTTSEREFWSHVKAPPTFVEGKLNLDGVSAVTTLLVEVLSVCDRIADLIMNPIVTANLKSLSLTKNDEGDGDDGPEDDSSEDEDLEGKKFGHMKQSHINTPRQARKGSSTSRVYAKGPWPTPVGNLDHGYRGSDVCKCCVSSLCCVTQS
jgi:hypothetical protein